MAQGFGRAAGRMLVVLLQRRSRTLPPWPAGGGGLTDYFFRGRSTLVERQERCGTI